MHTRSPIRWFALPTLIGALLTAVPVCWILRERPLEGLIGWMFANLALGGPAALLVTALTLRADRAALRILAPLRTWAAALLWIFAAQSAPAGLFVFVAIAGAAGGGPVENVAVGALPWGIALAALAGARLVERWIPVEAGAGSVGTPIVATAPLLAALLGIASALPSLGWLGWWVGRGWESDLVFVALGAWVLFGVGMAAFGAGAYGPLIQALDRADSPRPGQIELCGLGLVAHAIPWFGLGLSEDIFPDPDARFVVLGTAFGLVVFGTAIGSWGAALRRGRAAVPARDAAG